jgi:hypothetical protein
LFLVVNKELVFEDIVYKESKLRSPLQKNYYAQGKNNRHILIKIAVLKWSSISFAPLTIHQNYQKPIAKLMVNPTALHNENDPNPIPHRENIFWINSNLEY